MWIDHLNYHEVGSNITLSCYVTEPNSSLVDISTTVNIKWNSHKNISSQYTVHIYNKKFPLSLNSLKLSDTGEYNCSYYLTSESVNPFIKASDVRTGVTYVNIKSEYSY